MSDVLRDAFADGMQARHNGQTLEQCPFTGGLQSAWEDGWRSADADIATLKAVNETTRITVGEICDYLTRKAERFTEMGDAKSALLFETIVDYINREWGVTE